MASVKAAAQRIALRLRVEVGKLPPGTKASYVIDQVDQEVLAEVARKLKRAGFSTYISSGTLVVQKK